MATQPSPINSYYNWVKHWGRMSSYHQPITLGYNPPPEGYDAEPKSRNQCLIHFIVGLVSVIITVVSGILALTTPALSGSLIVWIVITGTAGLVGLINSIYIVRKSIIFDNKTLNIALITFVVSVGTVIATLYSSFKYVMRNVD